MVSSSKSSMNTAIQRAEKTISPFFGSRSKVPKRKPLQFKKKRSATKGFLDHRLEAAKLAAKLAMLSKMANRMTKIYHRAHRRALKLSMAIA